MYDKDETVNQAPLACVPKEPFDAGSDLFMKPIDEPAMRAYSLNAIIIPEEEKAPVQQKKASASKTKGKSKKFAVEKPPAGLVLRFPMEVWVSGGEAFVRPESMFSISFIKIKCVPI